MDEFTIRPMTANDGERVNAAFNEVFGTRRPLDEWAWKFRPEEGGSVVMVALDPTGNVAAQYGALAVRVQVDGRVVTAGQPVDVFALRRAAARAPRLYIRTAQEFFRANGGNPLAFIYGFPSDRPLRLGRLTMDYAPPQPVRYFALDVRRGHPFAWRRPWPVYRVTAEVVSGDLNALWSAAAARYAVAAVRDGNWLARRFLSRPHRTYLQLGARRRGRLSAWGAFWRENAVLHWVDLLWDGRDARSLDALSDAACRTAAGEGCERLDLWLNGDAAAERVLCGRGWTLRPQPLPLHLTAVGFTPEIDAADLARRFYLTMADSDLF